MPKKKSKPQSKALIKAAAKTAQKKPAKSPLEKKSADKTPARPHLNGDGLHGLSEPMKAGLKAVQNMPKRESKLDTVIALLQRPEGATLEDIMAATGWQKHTVRSAISHALAKKRGIDVVSDKPKDGQRIYKIVMPEK